MNLQDEKNKKGKITDSALATICILEKKYSGSYWSKDEKIRVYKKDNSFSEILKEEQTKIYNFCKDQEKNGNDFFGDIEDAYFENN